MQALLSYNIGLSLNRYPRHLLIGSPYLSDSYSTFPLGIPPIRQALAALLFRSQHPTAWPVGRHVVTSVTIVTLSFLFGIFVPELEFVFGLVGATAGENTR